MSDETIFVLIASYRDSQCSTTIRDLYDKARWPQNIYVGICWQFSASDPFDCVDPDQIYMDHIRIDRVPFQESHGVCWARRRASLLNRGENYTLFIDSHMLFENHWDEILISELKRCPSKRAVLSAYPPPFILPDIKTYRAPQINFVVRLENSIVLEGYPTERWRGRARWLVDLPEYEPLHGAVFAAGFCFMPTETLHEVPYDPYTDWEEEEVSYSLRLWLHGWDIYCCTKQYMHHLGTRDKKDSAHNFRRFTKADELYHRAVISKKRFYALLGIKTSDDPEVMKDLERYDLGHSRSLRRYSALTGAYFKEGRVSVRSRGVWYASMNAAHPVNSEKVCEGLMAVMRKSYEDRKGVALDAGSSMYATKQLRPAIIDFYKEYNISSVLDLGCGVSDWLIQKGLEVEHYVGVDFIPELIELKRNRHESRAWLKWICSDFRYEQYGSFDVIIVRDCLTHMSVFDTILACELWKASGSRYLLASHYELNSNRELDLPSGTWAKINLTKPPFNFPKPLALLPDQVEHGKYLALWKMDEIPDISLDQYSVPVLESHATLAMKTLSEDEFEFLYSLRDVGCFKGTHLGGDESIQYDMDVIRQNTILHRLLAKICDNFRERMTQYELHIVYFTQNSVSITHLKSSTIVIPLLPPLMSSLKLRWNDETAIIPNGKPIDLGQDDMELHFDLEQDEASTESTEWAVALICGEPISNKVKIM